MAGPWTQRQRRSSSRAGDTDRLSRSPSKGRAMRSPCSWQTAGRGWQVIPAAASTQRPCVDHLHQPTCGSSKRASLATRPGSDRRRSWPTWPPPPDYRRRHGLAQRPGGRRAARTSRVHRPCRSALGALLDFARIKAALRPTTSACSRACKTRAAAHPPATAPLLTLTRWDTDSLKALLTPLLRPRAAADLAHVETSAASTTPSPW